MNPEIEKLLVKKKKIESNILSIQDKCPHTSMKCKASTRGDSLDGDLEYYISGHCPECDKRFFACAEKDRALYNLLYKYL